MNDCTYEIGKKKMRRKIGLKIREREREREREKQEDFPDTNVVPFDHSQSTVLFYSRKLSCS